ncbi:MAG: glycoside hydrolase family 9 protein [Ruminococcus sp.]|nr:glycoside hydrolase family 9 protein [Ruminococcus sp.]
MKNKNLIRRITAGFTAFAASVACSATGAAPLPTAVAADDTDNYAKLLQYSMYLYDGNMCGNEVEKKSGFSWRGNCHTDDAVPGGFHDCGDHVKFGITAGYSGTTLGWAYYEYKDVFDELGQTGHLKLLTDHFCKYFKDCTTLNGDTVSDFVYQIGDGGMDHNSYWGPPEEQDSSSRTVFKTSSGASDVAAEYAAALAVNYLNFGNEEDLKYAKALYNFSKQYNQCATQGVTPYYESKGCDDDQAFAAGFLYLATHDESYNTALKSYAGNPSNNPNWDYCWDKVAIGASILNGEINGDFAIASNYAKQKYTNASSWYCLNSWGAARYNTAAQYTGLLLTKYKQGDYSAWAQSQMDMILGKNPKNVCVVVGFNDVSAKYPHHEAASGLKGWDEYNQAGATFGPRGGHVLTGALEGGFQDAGFTYKDELSDITSSEVGIDYNATLVAAAAGLYSIYKTGQIDAQPNGVDRAIQYDSPVTTTSSETTTTTTTTETTTTTTVTTTAERAKAIVNVNILDPDTKKQVPGVEYQITGGGEWGSLYGMESYTSGDTTDVIDVNWHDSTDLSDVKYWQINIRSVPDGYLTPTPLNRDITFVNGTADVEVVLEKAPDMSKLTFELIVKDKETGEYVPGVEFTISATESGVKLGEKKYTTLDGVNDINCTWEEMDDPKVTSWKATITSVPEGYKMPDDAQTIFVFATKNTIEKTYELERSSAPTVLWGDANLDTKVTIADAVAILQSIANKDKYALKTEGAANADVYANGDGVTAKDAYVLQLVDAGKLKAADLPVAEGSVD